MAHGDDVVEVRLEDTIDRLLRYANPDGEAHKRLTRYREQLDRNVMLGEGPRRFIASLLERLDNVECSHLDKDGGCRVKQGRLCKYRQRYKACTIYEEPRATVRNPAREIGADQ